MRRRIRSLAFALLRFSGLPWLVRQLVQRRAVTVVTYHAPAVAVARRHFKTLRNLYNVIPLKAYIHARNEQTMSQLPLKSLVITVDDGHKSNYELKPVLEEMALPVTIFLCSGVVGTQRHFWWQNGFQPGEVEACKAMNNTGRLSFLQTRGYHPEQECAERQALSDEEIQDLRDAVDFQAHTITHPILPACSDSTADQEIRGCKAELEKRYGFHIYAMAFPNGDYSERELNLVKTAGYTCALTLDRGFNGPETDLFRLRRIALPDDCSIHELVVKASGVWDWFYRRQ